MEVINQIWQSVGTPLTIILWVYIVLFGVVFAVTIGSFVYIFMAMLSDRRTKKWMEKNKYPRGRR